MELNDPNGGAQPGWVPPPGAWPPVQPAWAPVEKRKRFGWVALTIAFIVGGMISAVVTVAAIIGLAVLVGLPDSVAGTHPAPKEGVAMVKVGDCLSGDPGDAVVVDRSQVVDCNELHGSEVSAVLEVPGENHRPNDDDLQTYVDGACSLAFQGYVGSDPIDSQFDYAAVVPSDTAWAAGDRTAFCLVDTTSLDPGDGTARHSRR